MIERILDLPLYRLELPTPFPVGPVNVYLITEPEPVLIDTGPAGREPEEALARQLAEAGLRAEKLKKIVITHAHQDHYGMAADLIGRSGAPVYANPLDDAHLHHLERLDEFYRAMMEEAGATPELIAAIRDDMHKVRSTGRPLERYTPIQELGTLRCGPIGFETIATPGHTPGSVSFFEPQRRLMLAADTVLKHITPNPILDQDGATGRRFRSLRAYLDTLSMIRKLDPALIYTGHGKPVDNFPVLHDRFIHHHHKRRDLIMECIRTKPHTAHRVAACLFPEARIYNSFLAISEVFAHLDLLEEEGRVKKHFEGPVAIYES